MNDKKFKKALKEVEEKILGEINWEDVDEFIAYVHNYFWQEINKFWSLEEFGKRVKEEAESRRWDIRKFRNGQNQPITNLFKSLINKFARENNINITNDILSRCLNIVRKQYSEEAVLTGALFPVRAFFEREEYGIPIDLGDTNSCFRVGGANYGSALWLELEEREYNRAKFLFFHYSNGKSEGVGRCWFYQVTPHAIFITNFYSDGFDIKSEWLKKYVIRVARLLAGLPENVKYSYKNIPIPIYLNGDGIIIYDPEKHSQSEEVRVLTLELISRCLYCRDEIEIEHLERADVTEEIDGEEVSSPIICSYCRDHLEDLIECIECGERYRSDDMIYVDGEGYYCQSCYEDIYTVCPVCNREVPRDDMITDKYGEWMCSDCAYEHRRYCSICSSWLYPDEVDRYQILRGSYIEEVTICHDCVRELIHSKCDQCGKEFWFTKNSFMINRKIREIIREGLCSECFNKRVKEARAEIFKHPNQLPLPLFSWLDLLFLL
jgi:hypothetical protein